MKLTTHAYLSRTYRPVTCFLASATSEDGAMFGMCESGDNDNDHDHDDLLSSTSVS